MNLVLSAKVWFRCLSTSLAFCLAVANAHCRAQQTIGDSTLINADPTEFASAAVPAPAALPSPSPSDLPDAPRKAPPVAPAFDSLRLMGSTSLDVNDPEPEEPRLSFDVGTVYAVQNAVRARMPSTHTKSHSDDGAERIPEVDDEPWRHEKYHWGGLIAQSFFFNVFENAWRMASDDQIRYLVARKPFWHDYIASIHQFNMGRWNDGDDFLVNYIGHPLQGSVSSYIEIQNDPTGRQQEISATRDYWMSRFKGFLWATAFSAHSEISPLGEAGIGNEGGWTYPINCHRPCARWNPKTMKSTNNTGWVDFIITPTVGFLWVLAEDTLDRYISDRVQGDRRTAPFPLILRGALSPSRTMANAMRLKAPWYRDFQHGLPERYDRAPLRRGSYGVHMLPDDETPLPPLRRFSVSPHYRAMPLGSLNNPCAICMASHGVGFEVDYAINRWISASASLDKQDGLMTPKKLALREASSASDATGSTVLGGFGIRLVHDRPHNTFSVALRPGVVVDHVQVPAHVNTLQGTHQKSLEFTTTHSAASMLLSNDYKINRMFAVRSSFGATVVRYRTTTRDPVGIGKPPYITFLSHEYFTNHVNWIWQGGPVFHF